MDEYELTHPSISPSSITSPRSPILHGLSLQALTSRLSKVTEENSHHNNSTKSDYSDNDYYEEYECDPYGLPLSNPNSVPNPGAHITPPSLPPINTLSDHSHHTQHRHHNTPYHEEEDDDETNLIFDAYHDTTP